MNYIAHLNKVLNLFVQDFNLNPSHISLYMALFREWNFHRFSEKFMVQRKEVMNAAKIGSSSTYHKCITDLHDFRYLNYKPSKNPHKGSVVQMFRFKSCTGPKMEHNNSAGVLDSELYSPKNVLEAERYSPKNVSEAERYSPINVPVTIYKLENNKNIKQLKEIEVINFFKEKGQIPSEAFRFFRYYEKKQWMTKNKERITDWRSLAENWILNDYKINTGKKSSYFNDHLKTNKNKNYGEPL